MKPNRKDLEVAILDRMLGRNNYSLANPLGQTPSLLALVKTQAGKMYYLYFDLTGYPEECPSTFVKAELKDWKGNPLSTTDASMHCYGYWNGMTKLCLGWTSEWTPGAHLFALYVRGKIWLECYDRHLVTGKPIDYYLKHA